MGELKLCEHGNLYHCNLCEIKYLKNVIEEYKKENEGLKIKDDKTHEMNMKIYKICLSVMSENLLILINRLLNTLDPVK